MTSLTTRLLAATAVISLAACAGNGLKSGGNDWSANAVKFRGQNGVRYSYECPANGSTTTPWGTDLYTDDSGVCSAAVHSGLITIAQGGTVVIEIRPGASSYTGSLRNGIKTTDYGPWNGSYVFIAPGSSASPYPLATAT
jgi:hypothetical protein